MGLAFVGCVEAPVSVCNGQDCVLVEVLVVLDGKVFEDVEAFCEFGIFVVIM